MNKIVNSVVSVAVGIAVGVGVSTAVHNGVSKAGKTAKVTNVSAKGVKASRVTVDPKVRDQVVKDNKALVDQIKAKIQENKKATTPAEHKVIAEAIKALQEKIAENNKKMQGK